METIENIRQYSENLSLLFVEDDKDFAKDTLEIFDRFYTDITLSSNGKDALDSYKSYKNLNNKYHDIIITDISMPKMNGLEFAKEIYQQNPTQLIIVMSAYDDSNYLLNFLNLGVEYFIVKPFDIGEITTVLYKSSKKIYNQTKQPNNNIVELVNNYQWNNIQLELYYKSEYIKLTKKEQQFLEILIYNKSNILSHNSILNILWDDTETEATVNILNPIISRLKKKLPEELIESIYGIGYKLVSSKLEETQ